MRQQPKKQTRSQRKGSGPKNPPPGTKNTSGSDSKDSVNLSKPKKTTNEGDKK